jgi:hypothetical protein
MEAGMVSVILVVAVFVLGGVVLALVCDGLHHPPFDRGLRGDHRRVS